jgi:hypothetical protein
MARRKTPFERAKEATMRSLDDYDTHGTPPNGYTLELIRRRAKAEQGGIVAAEQARVVMRGGVPDGYATALRAARRR